MLLLILKVSDMMVINELHIFLIALPTLYYDCSFIDLLFAMQFDQLWTIRI